MGLPIFTNEKANSYDSILVIVNRLTRIVYYEPVKIISDAFDLTKIILDKIVEHYSLPNSIMSDWSLVFISKLWLSLCYFLGIKQKLCITFYSQTDA